MNRLNDGTERHALFWTPGPDGTVQCRLCQRRCVIAEGETGFCGARQIGFDAGLQFVYIGNVAMHPGESTFCPACKTLLIERVGGLVKTDALSVCEDGGPGKCRECGETIAGRFRAT